MPAFTRARVLIVAHQTADSDELVQAVSRRARDCPCTFTLMVPAVATGRRRVGAPRDYGLREAERDFGLREAERRLTLALPRLSRAAGAEVVGIVGSPEPLPAVRDALELLGFDEVIVSMLPAGLSRWQRQGLAEKIRGLGVAVTEVGGTDSDIEPVPAA